MTLNNELDEVERKRCQHVKGILPISRVTGCFGYLWWVVVGGGEQSCEVGNVNISQPCPYGGAKLPFLGYHRVALLSIRVQGAPKGCRWQARTPTRWPRALNPSWIHPAILLVSAKCQVGNRTVEYYTFVLFSLFFFFFSLFIIISITAPPYGEGFIGWLDIESMLQPLWDTCFWEIIISASRGLYLVVALI